MWGWWGSSDKKDSDRPEGSSSENDANEPSLSQQDVGDALVKGIGGVWSTVASAASKVKSVVSDSVGATFIGDFDREQQKFLKEKKSGRSDAAVPPWVGYNEEEAMKTQIMALSSDKRNFLRSPPQGVQFHFDFATSYPVALATLGEDTNLQKMRFELVPRLVSEEMFWRNYFYRVSLIKQSTQLTSLANAAEEQLKRRSSGGRDDSPPKSQEETSRPHQHEEEVETLPESPADEFVSDSFSHHEAAELSQAELGQLGVGDQPKAVVTTGQKKKVKVSDGDWESELQEELQRFGVEGLNEDEDDETGHQDKDDEAWEAEIEQMLEMDKEGGDSN